MKNPNIRFKKIEPDLQNYPNPLNPETIIRYHAPQTGLETLSIYNSLGEKIRTLAQENLAAGDCSAVGDGRDSSGKLMSSGMYFYRLRVGESKA